jgi:hypothetical protein
MGLKEIVNSHILQVGDKVEHKEPYQNEVYYGTITEIWVVVHDGGNYTRMRVVRDMDDPTSWWACNPEDVRKIT